MNILDKSFMMSKAKWILINNQINLNLIIHEGAFALCTFKCEIQNSNRFYTFSYCAKLFHIEYKSTYNPTAFHET